jgi:hypothetical protein
MDGKGSKGHFIYMHYISKRAIAFILVLHCFIMLAHCSENDKAVNRLSLVEAQKRGFIYRVYNMSEGLQAAQLTEANDFKIGFYNVNGKVVIPFSYYKASDEAQIIFKNDLAPVANKDNKAGYINKKGMWVIKPIFSYAASFYDGIAYVRGIFEGKNRAAYINVDSSFFIKPNYSLIYYFPPDNICIFVNGNGKWGLCKPDGSITVKPIYDDAVSVSEGIALFGIKGKYGFINLSGKKITNFEYDDARNFLSGTAIVAKNDGGNNFMYGVIDKKGNYLIPLRSDIEINISGIYSGLHLFQDYLYFEPWLPSPIIDGLFSAREKSTGLYGLMNLNGEWVNKPVYKSLLYNGDKKFKFVTYNNEKGEVSTGDIIQ